MTALELAVTDLAGLRVALDLGMDRVEVCGALEVGGITPSLSLVARAIELAAGSGLGIHPIVRARAGGFTYSDDEVAVMVADVRRLVEVGADGVVVGVLRDGGVDLAALAALREAAGPLELTFHRAVDAVTDPGVLDVLGDAGVARVLTAGGADVSAGLPALRAMCSTAGRRVQVMAGGGVNETNLVSLLEAGVDAVHFSAGTRVQDPSAAAGGYGSHQVTDPERARALVELARAHGA
ncbi:copper homeostasis protein CutC [Cellulomonas edaphi]|uniref:PF03932 family protein CutC n=1 Tax=Cellulomonas edaphi TaxID=3053468 RepID=A0ABT7SA89_9CELL|nr:copper homeostasis protein CutC [Cellulomons edaphi]MDM7832548.1 copper homeostasis protein CutC [Cellulomons edaphi]